MTTSDHSKTLHFHQKRHNEREQILLNPFRSPSVITFIKAITLWSIWPSVTFFTAFATVVILIHRHVASVAISPVILTVLGTVLGFVVSYRTSSAYERYNDGRKQWSSISLGGRTLARLIWLHCPISPRPVDPNQPLTEKERLASILEKKTIINLIEGFAVSLKHYLRGEHGIYYEDLYHLACFLPKYAFPAGHPLERPDLGFTTTPCHHTTSPMTQSREMIVDRQPGEDFNVPEIAILDKQSTVVGSEAHRTNEKSSTNVSSAKGHREGESLYQRRKPTVPLDPFRPDRDLLPAYNPPREGFVDILPFLSIFRSVWKGTRNVTGLRRRKGAHGRVIHDDNVPLEIIWYISSYIALLQQRKVLDVPTTNSLMAAVLALTDALTTLERILTTPIPFGYIVHLKLVIWGYLLFLPFQLVSAFGYLTIPALALVSTAFLGFLRVGEEIENPFGYDLNDLDMDHFCHHIIAPELAEITARPPPDPTQFIFSTSNIPLMTQHDLRSGADLFSCGITSYELQDLLKTRASRVGDLPSDSTSPV